MGFFRVGFKCLGFKCLGFGFVCFREVDSCAGEVVKVGYRVVFGFGGGSK